MTRATDRLIKVLYMPEARCLAPNVQRDVERLFIDDDTLVGLTLWWALFIAQSRGLVTVVKKQSGRYVIKYAALTTEGAAHARTLRQDTK